MADDLYELAPKEDDDPKRATPRRDVFREVERAIEKDRSCPTCGYNLKGLEVGGRCPECGEGIRDEQADRKRKEIAFHETSDAYMRLVQLGFTLLCLGWFGLFASAIANRWLITLASFGMFWAGTLALCAPRPIRPDETRPAGKTRALRWTKLRVGVLLTQLGAPVGAFTIAWLGPGPISGWFSQMYGAFGATPPASVWDVAFELFAWAWVIGFGLVALLSARYADWMADEERGRALTMVALWLPGLSLVWEGLDWIGAWLSAPLLSFLISLAGLLFSVATFVMYFYFGWSLFVLARAAAWGPRTKRRQLEREERLRQKLASERAAAEAERQRRASFGGPLDGAARPERSGPERGDLAG